MCLSTSEGIKFEITLQALVASMPLRTIAGLHGAGAGLHQSVKHGRFGQDLDKACP